jgi:Trypsin-like peptidase domain
MWRLVYSVFVFAGWAHMIEHALPAQEANTHEAIAKRAKAATVLIKVDSDVGSGFCVHPSGLFITNEHVVQRNRERITLVLDAGMKTQKLLDAKALRWDSKRDLALLKVEGSDKFQSLELGSDDDLGELKELIAFGFPFGQALALEGEYPSISVNQSRITSLRRDKDGELHRIQLDGGLNPGHSGGPVLDSSGKVVAVVESGILGSGIALAIPVSHVQSFLAIPEINVNVPTVKADDRHENFEFTAQVMSGIPLKKAHDLELVLRDGHGTERRFPMANQEGVYHAKVVPFPQGIDPSLCRVEVKYENGAVSGITQDQPFRIGGTDVKLSQIRALRLRPMLEARLADDKVLSGALDGPKKLPLRVGGQTLRLDLTSALELNAVLQGEVTALSCIVIAKYAGREVGRRSEALYIKGISEPSLEALTYGKFVQPLRNGSPVSYLRVVSSEGDYIGQGKKYSYTGDDLKAKTNGNLISVDIGRDPQWVLRFASPDIHPLKVGEYFGAKRSLFNENSPGLEFTGEGRGCNQIDGKFVVWEIELNGNEVVRLAIDFVQRCEESMPPLFGSLRINSTYF